jgi:hypothetical protein
MENSDVKLLERIFPYFAKKKYGWKVIWQTVGDALTCLPAINKFRTER